MTAQEKKQVLISGDFMVKLRIGVVGYSTNVDETKALELIVDAFDKINAEHPEEKEVVSGFTDIGISAIAYREAKRRKWRTVGIACKKAFKHPCYVVDDYKIIGENWGDESKTFLDSIDVLVRVGGGNQAMKETEEFKKTGKPVYEYELQV